jgi:hypothetical protein
MDTGPCMQGLQPSFVFWLRALFSLEMLARGALTYLPICLFSSQNLLVHFLPLHLALLLFLVKLCC